LGIRKAKKTHELLEAKGKESKDKTKRISSFAGLTRKGQQTPALGWERRFSTL